MNRDHSLSPGLRSRQSHVSVSYSKSIDKETPQELSALFGTLEVFVFIPSLPVFLPLGPRHISFIESMIEIGAMHSLYCSLDFASRCTVTIGSLQMCRARGLATKSAIQVLARLGFASLTAALGESKPTVPTKTIDAFINCTRRSIPDSRLLPQLF